MKKYSFILIAVLALLSCEKTQVEVNNEGDIVTLQATICSDLDDATKTDYIIDDENNPTKAIFCWKGAKGQEKIGRITFDGEATTGCVFYSNDVAANSGEKTLSFTGTQNINQIDYAVYPSKDETNGAKLDWYTSANSIYLWLGESLTYSKDSPLERIVPMVGKLTDGEFKFNVISGLLAIRVKHMPASANKIAIISNHHYISKLGFRNSSSDNGYLNEWDAIYENGLLLNQCNTASSRSKVKYYTFTAGDLTFDNTYTFYFPIPAGKLVDDTASDNLTITVYNGESELYSMTTNKAIELSNATITRLPVIDFAKLDMGVTGNAHEFSAYIKNKGKSINSVKVAIASTADGAITAARSSSIVISTPGVGAAEDVTGSLSTSGKYYIGYVGYDSSSVELVSGSMLVYYLSDAHVTKFCKVFTGKHKASAVSYPVVSFELQASNNPLEGNLMLTSIAGITCNSNPIYGIHIQGGNIDFPNDPQKVFCSDETGSYIIGCSSTGGKTFKLLVDYTETRESPLNGKHTLVSNPQYINIYKNGSPYMDLQYLQGD